MVTSKRENTFSQFKPAITGTEEPAASYRGFSLRREAGFFQALTRGL